MIKFIKSLFRRKSRRKTIIVLGDVDARIFPEPNELEEFKNHLNKNNIVVTAWPTKIIEFEA